MAPRSSFWAMHRDNTGVLSKAVVNQVLELLAAGELSQRAIAKQLGVSRGTVSGLATGRRGDFVSEPDAETATVFRCPRCRATVVSRCVRCDAELYRERHGSRLPSLNAESRPPDDQHSPDEIASMAAMLRRARSPLANGACLTGHSKLSGIRVVCLSDVAASAS